ncbi:FMN-binding negative transcriptional regulator [Sulfoacidibacillus thermotolerans]|uniref:Transcriptional regulator n=1 Tax=Sulfoacidibacillus thermotolerans TaxID=1765684 RepID=A0A2U3D6L9_SULT2|nr:FMN-binding negative transcriptional regulator [Sulfoacidibacillus thermotolerans]PWI56926.1 hypothetical protein BM613_11005 [Sulfoacidibacillus thermotolerans]
MYIPSSFVMDDPQALSNFIRLNSFGILVSTDQVTPIATHLPFLYDEKQNALFAHMAKANPQWKALDGQMVLTIFPGPHAYISPSWYGDPASVPTWNYLAVHVLGKCSIIKSRIELASILEQLVRFYEPSSDLPERATEPFYQNMMNEIVGFRIDITHIEGVAKLSQNKSPAIQQRVAKQLSTSTDVMARNIGALMQDRAKGELGN